MTRPKNARTLDDLIALTGLCRDTVKAAVLSGELPGYKVGTRYFVPDEAFQLLSRGEWVAHPRPVLANVAPTPIVRINKRESA